MKERLEELGVEILDEAVNIYGPSQLFIAAGAGLSMGFIGFTFTLYLLNKIKR